MEPNRVLLDSVEKAKRQAVPAACQHCRSKRTKCNGEQPCAACAKRGIECVYVTKLEENETRQQAYKRKFDELSQAHQDLQSIYDILADPKNEHRALDVFRRIRNGQTPDTILRELQHANVQRPVTVSREQRLRQNFLILLTQSTASLDEVKSVAAWALSPTSSIALPTKNDCNSLRDSTVSLHDLIEILREVNPSMRQDPFLNTIGAPSAPPSSPREAYIEPKYWVPARPWTELTESDAVSQLVSVFLALANTSWRFIEQDMFLRDMRSGNPGAQYCSPLLVHAILSLASQYSEIDEALTQPGNLATRGERFHREAVRLWHLEEEKGSVTNLQALNIMHLDAFLRGKETLAGALLSSAHNLRQSFLGSTTSSNVSDTDGRTTKRILAATTMCMELIFHFALLCRSHSFQSLSYEPLDLDSTLPDTKVYWTAGLYRREPIPYHMNLQLRHRCHLATILRDVCETLLSQTSRPSPHEFVQQSGDLAARLQQWNATLPRLLQYQKVMPWGLYELHAEYLCIMMTLHVKTSEILFAEPNETSDNDFVGGHNAEELRSLLRQQALQHACQAATVARDFRETYGLKIITPFIIHAIAMANFVFITDLQRKSQQANGGGSSQHSLQQDREAISTSDIEAAFGECFRCLLGAGMQHTYPRAVVRIIYHTASSLRFPLPENALQMLQIVNENSWRPVYTDDAKVRAGIEDVLDMPQYANHGQFEMEDLLKRWEELGLQDKATLLSAEDEIQQSIGSPGDS